MQFTDVVQQRRMVRRFRSDQVPSSVIDELLRLAERAPSAGNTWGTHFVVLSGTAETSRYWDVTLPQQRRSDFAWPGLLQAPVIVLPCGDAAAYVDRYSEDDKAHSGLGEDVRDWPIPYWHVDTAMATMTLLHGAVDVGLGALFFGLFGHEAAICREFGIPESVRPIGAVAIGVADEGDRTSRSAARGRPPLESFVHRGGW